MLLCCQWLRVEADPAFEVGMQGHVDDVAESSSEQKDTTPISHTCAPLAGARQPVGQYGAVGQPG